MTLTDKEFYLIQDIAILTIKLKLTNTMKNNLIYLLAFVLLQSAFAQTNPVITKWLQNNTTTGTYYTSGNSTAISNGILVNCQQVRYSANFVYVNATEFQRILLDHI